MIIIKKQPTREVLTKVEEQLLELQTKLIHGKLGLIVYLAISYQEV
jgi:hypothetical protein